MPGRQATENHTKNKETAMVLYFTGTGSRRSRGLGGYLQGVGRRISHLPRSAEQKPHTQQDRKEDQVGQGEQPKILLLPLWQLPCDLSVGNKTGHGCDQSAKTSQIGADDEGLCLCREPGQQQGGGNITGDLRSKNRHQHFPAGQKLLQPAGKGRNAAKIANEDEKSHKGQKQGKVHRP